MSVPDLRVVDVPERTRIRWLADALDYQPPPQLVQGLIPRGGLIVIYGEPGTGKSTIAIDLGLHVASGQAWRGRAVEKGLVLHLAGEGIHGLNLRLLASVRAGLIDPGAAFAVLDGGLDLAQQGDVGELLETVSAAESEAGEKLALLTIDTLARLFGIDENDGSQMRQAIGACDLIRAETGAAVVLVHHAGKDTAKGARGHSSLRAAVDTELLVEGRANPRTLSVTKQRDLALADPVLFELVPVKVCTDLGSGEDVTACVVRHSDQAPPRARPSGKQQAQLLAELERRYGQGEVAWTDADLRAVGRALGMHKNTARSAVLGLFVAQYLTPSVGGATLSNPPVSEP